ncbi:acyltransferase [Egibacter rhizosphaerae]
MRAGGPRIHLEEGVIVGRFALFQGRGTIRFGPYSRCRANCLFDAGESISVGAYTGIADYVSVRDTDHRFERTDQLIRDQGVVTSPVEIGRDVWIGHGATILKGVTIGNGAVVAAGAVVIEDVPELGIVGGVPAKVIGYRGEGTAG